MAIPYNLRKLTSSESKLRIFSSNNDGQLNESLENAAFINGYDLFTYFPAKYNDRNKKALLEDLMLNKKYVPSKYDLLITRFNPRQLPNHYTLDQHNDLSKSYSFVSNVFDYKPTDDSNSVEWHMNFANCDIFSYYHSSLLAQDELQVLECPLLACLREYLIKQDNATDKGDQYFDTHVIENNSPYPILICNVERAVDLNTKNLYGNKFSTSSESTVLNSYTLLNPPQIINLIAIEAPKYGYGSYTHQQIEYILQACFTAYSAAKVLANTAYELKTHQSVKASLKTYIHTGWFGCGAYGGDRTIMIVLQILAAKMAGIDKLIFHTVTNNCENEIDVAENCLKQIFSSGQNQLSINELINGIINKNFQWGASNGT
ncbi:hypothetical protein I4U23_020704 [Adineta vaga]|nr:hypothetical protein I4U23_020704 [Adineta vaga]